MGIVLDSRSNLTACSCRPAYAAGGRATHGAVHVRVAGGFLRGVDNSAVRRCARLYPCRAFAGLFGAETLLGIVGLCRARIYHMIVYVGLRNGRKRGFSGRTESGIGARGR